jgi:vacuolar-type H+-ATPase subunit I/STV1
VQFLTCALSPSVSLAAASIGVGVVMPLFSLIFGGILDAFNGIDAERRVDQYSLYFLYLAIASFLLNVGMSCCFSISSERQIRRMRLVSTLVN